MTSRYVPRIDRPGSGGGGPPPQIEDHFAPRVLVGNVPNGDPAVGQAAPFEYIPDTGDGAGIAAALTAVGALGGGDVWVRPGTYDLSTGAAAPLTIPSNVRLVGAGPSTIIVGDPTQRTVISLTGIFSCVERLQVQVPPNAAAPVGTHVVEAGLRSVIRDVVVLFTGASDAAETLLGGIGATTMSFCFVENCLVQGITSQSQNLFAAYDINGQPNRLVGNVATAGDIGLRVTGADNVVETMNVLNSVTGAQLSGGRNKVHIVGEVAGGFALDCQTLFNSHVSAIMNNSQAPGATVGIQLDGTSNDNSIVGANLTGFATAVAILTGATRNSLGFCHFFSNGVGIVDAGTDTEQAHNQVA